MVPDLTDFAVGATGVIDVTRGVFTAASDYSLAVSEVEQISPRDLIGYIVRYDISPIFYDEAVLGDLGIGKKPES